MIEIALAVLAFKFLRKTSMGKTTVATMAGAAIVGFALLRLIDNPDARFLTFAFAAATIAVLSNRRIRMGLITGITWTCRRIATRVATATATQQPAGAPAPLANDDQPTLTLPTYSEADMVAALTAAYPHWKVNDLRSADKTI